MLTPGRLPALVALRAFPATYAFDVEAAASFWELLGFPSSGPAPARGRAGSRARERWRRRLADTYEQWAADQYGLSLGTGPRLEMYVYVDDVMLRRNRTSRGLRRGE
jgi:lactoylglutathione lyase